MQVGTVHIYLPDIDADFRGIHYIWKKNRFHIRFPSRKGVIDDEECQYLVFSFCSAEKQKQLTQAIKEALREFAKTDFFDKHCKDIR